MLAFNGFKLYSPNSFIVLQNLMIPLILPTVSLAAELNAHGYVATF